MLRIGICDDEAGARDALRFGLEKVLREESEQIVYEFSTGESAVRWLKKHPGEIDLLFLDVEMKGVNGMEAAAEIREFDKEISLVFVTGYADYVFDGYKVNALDYVIKPAGTERLAEVLGRVRKRIFDHRKRCFSFKNAEGTYRLPLSDISYFYSDRRKVNAVCARGGEGFSYSFYGKLDEVERQLSGAFVRVHQRYLVNPAKVMRIGNESVTVESAGGAGIGGRSGVMQGSACADDICADTGRGTDIPMSRAMKEEAVAKLARAMLEGEEL